MNLSDINTIKSILAQNGFHFSKALGQNFLVNPEVCPEMAELSGVDKNSGVIEIGPGIGVLTSELAKRAKKVVAVELDKRLLPVLDKTLAPYDNICIVNEDILKLDLKELLYKEFGDMPLYICANLPYYITSPVIMLFLESGLDIKRITVMVQREAADRLCAEPGERESGAVTIAVNYYARAGKLFDVDRDSFLPPPNVDSSVIYFDIREKPPIDIDDKDKFFKMVKAAFSQRRKTAANSISAGLGVPKESVISALKNAGLSPSVRAEALDMQALEGLYKTLNNI